MHLRLELVEPEELPEGQDWLFVELCGEMTTLLSKTASGESMARGLRVVHGLLIEMEERKRLEDVGRHGAPPSPPADGGGLMLG